MKISSASASARISSSYSARSRRRRPTSPRHQSRTDFQSVPQQRERFVMPIQRSLLRRCSLVVVLLLVLPSAPLDMAAEPIQGAAGPFDILIRGGTVYDGSGQAPV